MRLWPEASARRAATDADQQSVCPAGNPTKNYERSGEAERDFTGPSRRRGASSGRRRERTGRREPRDAASGCIAGAPSFSRRRLRHPRNHGWRSGGAVVSSNRSPEFAAQTLRELAAEFQSLARKGVWQARLVSGGSGEPFRRWALRREFPRGSGSSPMRRAAAGSRVKMPTGFRPGPVRSPLPCRLGSALAATPSPCGLLHTRARTWLRRVQKSSTTASTPMATIAMNV